MGDVTRFGNVARRLMLLGAVGVALTGICSAGLTPAAKASSLKAAGAGYSLVSDGSRFVAFQRPDGTPMVFDSKNGKVRPIDKSKGCEPSGVSFGTVLVNCADGYSRDPKDFRPSRVASVWTGKSREIPNASKHEEYSNGEIGRHWVRGDCQAPSPCYWTTYTNFRTGAKKTYRTVGASVKAPAGLGYQDFDLNYRNLGRFRPHPGFSIFGKDFNWEKNYIGFGASYYLLNKPKGMYLVPKPKKLVRIGGQLRQTSYNWRHAIARGSGKLAWVQGRWLWAYDLHSGQRIRRKLPKLATGLAVIGQGSVVAFPTKSKSDGNEVSRLRIVKF